MNPNPLSWTAFTLATLLGASAGLAAPRIAVTTNADRGPGSLRAGLAAIVPDDGLVTVSFAALRGADRVIRLEAPLELPPGSRVYFLGASLGAQARVVLDGQGRSQILQVSGPEARVTLEQVECRNGAGADGGALRFDSAQGTLTLDRCVFRGNQGTRGGAVFVGDGRLRAFDSRFVGNLANPGAGPQRRGQGGAILLATTAPTRLRRCAFDGNRAADSGGAVADLAGPGLSGELFVDESDFEGNAAGNDGGALCARSRPLRLEACSLSGNVACSGGAVYLGQGAATVRQCTLWANQALGGRGGALRAVTLDLGHCTLVDNSPSGVELVRERGASAQAQVNDSALVGNGSGDLVLGEGVVLVRSRHSVYGTLRGGASGATDRVGVERSQLALAATPERYGQVRVLPLEPGSVLIDSGDPAAAGAPAFDARGAPYARVRDGGTAERLDVGAFEVQRPFPKVVETLEPTLAGPSAVLGDDEAPPAAAVEPQDAPARVTGLSKADATQKALAGPSPSADPPAPPAAQGAAPLQAGRTFEDRSAEAAPSAPAPPRRSPYLHQGSMNAIRNLR